MLLFKQVLNQVVTEVCNMASSAYLSTRAVTTEKQSSCHTNNVDYYTPMPQYNESLDNSFDY